MNNINKGGYVPPGHYPPNAPPAEGAPYAPPNAPYPPVPHGAPSPQPANYVSTHEYWGRCQHTYIHTFAYTDVCMYVYAYVHIPSPDVILELACLFIVPYLNVQ